jgi:signal transduction histidine kinase
MTPDTNNTLKFLLLTAIFFFINMPQIFSRKEITDSLAFAAKYEKDALKKISLWYLIGSNYKQINADSSFYYFSLGLKHAAFIKHDSLMGLGYFYLASFEAKRSNNRAALNYADSSLKYLKNTTNDLQLSILKNLKSNIYLKQLSVETKINRSAVKNQRLTSNILFGAVIIIILFSVLLFNRYQLKKKIENQEALLTERKRISHELHDNLGSQLCAVKIFLTDLKKNEAIKNSELLENSLGLVDASIKDLRLIMDDLQTSTLLENGYLAATTELVNKVSHLKEIKFNLSHNGFQSRLGNKKETNLFRITQELINNTLKYAQAKNVTIDVLSRDNNLILMYEDDGNGFNLQSAKTGYGLNNIQSRSHALGGTVSFDSWPGAGFRATIEIPLLYA